LPLPDPAINFRLNGPEVDVSFGYNDDEEDDEFIIWKARGEVGETAAAAAAVAGEVCGRMPPRPMRARGENAAAALPIGGVTDGECDDGKGGDKEVADEADEPDDEDDGADEEEDGFEVMMGGGGADELRSASAMAYAL
jgi:hypothetical protein